MPRVAALGVSQSGSDCWRLGWGSGWLATEGVHALRASVLVPWVPLQLLPEEHGEAEAQGAR